MQQFLLAIVIATAFISICNADIDPRCLDCICQKETGCDHNRGCNAGACGAFQIRQPYFQDCCRFLGDSNCDSVSAWQNCANDYNCAVRCVQAYVNTYGPLCSGRMFPICEVYARVHNGGANGCNNSNTDAYWNDVKHCYGDQNPYLYPCTTNDDCTNIRHDCSNSEDDEGWTDPNGWFCNCFPLLGDPCSSNADCCSNICFSNGTCAQGGGQGTVCMNVAIIFGCAPGCQCLPFDDFGYCNC